MQDCNLLIEYVRGKSCIVTDALSREAVEGATWETIQDVNKAVLNSSEFQETDKWLRETEVDAVLDQTLLKKGEREWISYCAECK